MNYLISIVVGIVLNAIILAVLPFVRYKNFSACLQVSALTSLITTLAIPFQFIAAIVSAFFLAWIPLLGPIAMVLGVILISFVLSVGALFAADQIVEDFEIATLSQTVAVAVLLAIASGVSKSILGL